MLGWQLLPCCLFRVHLSLVSASFSLPKTTIKWPQLQTCDTETPICPQYFQGLLRFLCFSPCAHPDMAGAFLTPCCTQDTGTQGQLRAITAVSRTMPPARCVAKHVPLISAAVPRFSPAGHWPIPAKKQCHFLSPSSLGTPSQLCFGPYSIPIFRSLCFFKIFI